MPTARLPRDIELRNRLQQAQRAEADAVALVYQADAALARTCAKREAVVAAADAEMQRAQQSVGEAQQHLVEISGLDRAAQLLGLRRTDLRRSSQLRPAGVMTLVIHSRRFATETVGDSYQNVHS